MGQARWEFTGAARDLKRNLIDLGYADGLGPSADETFTAGTETAVKRWQKKLGAPKTGQIDPAAVVMLDLPRLRVQESPGIVGSPLTGTALLRVTGTVQVATAKGILAGLYPALRASRLAPTEALRSL